MIESEAATKLKEAKNEGQSERCGRDALDEGK
jgi:hypothetical protein